MATLTSPSGRVYTWDKPGDPSEADIQAIVDYDASLPAPQGMGDVKAAEATQMQQAVEDAGRIGMATAAARAGGGGFVASPSVDVGRSTAQGVATALRVGLPAAAAPTGVLGMGAAGAIGEELAQTIEGAAGLRKEPSPGAIAGAGITAATPIAKVGQTFASPVASALYTGGKQALLNQLTTGVASVAEKALDEGRAPTLDELVSAATDWHSYLSGALGGAVGTASGFAGTAQKTATKAEQTARAGAAARTSLEAQGIPAPLTATQQTGRNILGEFKTSSGEMGAQEAVAGRVSEVIGAPGIAEPSTKAEEEILGGLQKITKEQQAGMAKTEKAATRKIESVLAKAMPSSPAAASFSDAARAVSSGVAAEDASLKAGVDRLYGAARRAEAAITQNGALADQFRIIPTPVQKAVDDVLDTLAKEEITTVTPSAIIGGTPTTTVERVPAALYSEVTSLAEKLKSIASSPQSLSEISQLKQSVDDVISGLYKTQISPGSITRSATALRNSIKQAEIMAANKLGGNVPSLLAKAQSAAKSRFDKLESNPILLKLLKGPDEGGYQNIEKVFDELAAKPEALSALQKFLPDAEFEQVRRGLFDSLRPNARTGVSDAKALAENFRKLPEETKAIVMGDSAKAQAIQTALDDAQKVQYMQGKIPTTAGLSDSTLREIADHIGTLSSKQIQKLAARDLALSVDRTRTFYNSTMDAVRKRTLDPTLASDQFVRDVLLQTDNRSAVTSALNQLTPTTRAAVGKQAAKILVEAIDQHGSTFDSLEKFLDNGKRLAIASEIIGPRDMAIIDDFAKWSQAKLVMPSGKSLEKNRLEQSVWRIARATMVVDALVGNSAAQDFLAKVSRAKDFVNRLAPGMNPKDVTDIARAFNSTTQEVLSEWSDYRKEAEAIGHADVIPPPPTVTR